MPVVRSWICSLCEKPVGELGAYVKISQTKYVHLPCYSSQLNENAKAQGRQEILDEQNREKCARMEQERKAQEDQQARERAEAERRLEIAERERTNRIIAQQNMPLPPKLEVKKPDAPKEEATRPDRFSLIDIK